MRELARRAHHRCGPHRPGPRPRLPVKQRTRLVNAALLSRHLRPAPLADVVDRNPLHPGSRLLRPFLDAPGNPTRSGLEDEFLAFVAAYDLPVPQINVRIGGREVDAFFAEHNLIVELDGWETHRDREAFEDDRERDVEHLRSGTPTLRITRERFEAAPEREAARLAHILGQDG